MTPNLTPLTAVPGGSGSSPGASQNGALNQLDSQFSGEFQALLGAAYGAAPGGGAGGVPTLPADLELPAELQSLPQDGKLLPWLRQVVGGAAVLDADSRTLLQNVAAALERSGTVSGQQMAERIEQVLQQLTDGETIPAGVVPPGLAALVTAASAAPAASGAVADAAGRLLPQVADALRPPAGNATEQVKTPLEAGREQQPGGAGKLPETSFQPSPETGQRASESLAVLAALRNPGNSLKPPAGVSNRSPESVSAAVAQTVLPPTGAASGGALPTVSVDVPVQQGNWDQALGERIQWLLGQRMQGAQIKLNPANLGPLEVRIQMQQDQASIQFTSTHAVVREALEAALPRLRDMFESAGVQLLDVDVSGQQLAQQQRAPQEHGAPRLRQFRSGSEDSVETVLESRVDSMLTAGRLDLFA